MGTTTVTRNYQITLPKDVREVEHIKIGDRLIVEVKDDAIELKKFSRERLLGSFGIWETKEDSVEFVRKIRSEAEERLQRMGL